MEKTAENKKYATDTRKFSVGTLTDGIHTKFTDSPITDVMLMKDLCYRGYGFIGQHGKESKTSWDTLSYTLLQAHNVYQHIFAVQEGNRRYDSGVKPTMVLDRFDGRDFGHIVDDIFSCKDREKSLELVDRYDKFWQQIKAGQGFSGKKTVNSHTMFNQLFNIEETSSVNEVDYDDSDDILMEEITNEL